MKIPRYLVLVLLIGANLVISLNQVLNSFKGNDAVAIKNGTMLNSFTIKRGGSSILCSSICMKDVSCVTFSVDTSTACYFFSQIFSFVYNASQITFLYSVFSFELLPGATAFYNADGTLYMFALNQTQTWQQSHDLCYTVQGFVALQPKKIYQFQLLYQQYLANFKGYYAVGLRRNSSLPTAQQVFFDDGTLFQNTEVANYTNLIINDGSSSTIFHFRGLRFDDWWTTTNLFPTTPICRADPYNVTGDLVHA